METLTHIPSNMTNDECFRLTGALPTARIVELLDEGDRFRDAARDFKTKAETIRTGVPCEDFAADVIYDLEQLRDDEATMSEEAATSLTRIIKDLRALQDEVFWRANKAEAALETIEDALAEWTDS